MGAPLDWSKLAKIVGMMGSSAAGEALNARDLAQAMLREAGLSWVDLKSLVASGQAPPVAAPVFASWDRGNRWDAGWDRGGVNQTIIDLQNLARRLTMENEALKLRTTELEQSFWSTQRQEMAGVEASRQLTAENEALKQRTALLEQRLEYARRTHRQEMARVEASWRALTVENSRLTEENSRLRGEPAEPAEPALEDWPIADLGVSTRLKNALTYEGITTLRAAAKMRGAELLRVPNFGKKCLRELCEVCCAHGVRPPEGAIF
jgi:hypothetical protein